MMGFMTSWGISLPPPQTHTYSIDITSNLFCFRRSGGEILTIEARGDHLGHQARTAPQRLQVLTRAFISCFHATSVAFACQKAWIPASLAWAMSPSCRPKREPGMILKTRSQNLSLRSDLNVSGPSRTSGSSKKNKLYIEPLADQPTSAPAREG